MSDLQFTACKNCFMIMLMSSPDIPFSQSQLTVVRYANPEDLGVLAAGLQDNFGDIPGMDLRQFEGEIDPRKSPSFRLIDRGEVSSRSRMFSAIPTGPVVENIKEQIPALLYEQRVTLALAEKMTNRKFENFALVKPDSLGRGTLMGERDAIFTCLGRIAKVPNLTWKTSHMDMTLAYVSQEVGPRQVDELIEYIGSLLPLQVRLEPAVIKANPSYKSQRESM